MVWLYSSSIRDHEVQIFESIIHPTGDYLNTHHVRVPGEPHTTIVHIMDTTALNQYYPILTQIIRTPTTRK